MPEKSIDINCDLGEINIKEAPRQLKILDYISSCNIATGFHAGDPYTILKNVQEAQVRNVAIGVHPSYPDKEGFGRVSMDMSPKELYASLLYQISALAGMCEMAGMRLHHVKLHGALYHDALKKKSVAEVVVRLVEEWPHPLMIYGQSGSILESMSKETGIPWVQEGFTDRSYQKDGNLVPRNQPGAVLESPARAIRQALSIIQYQKVVTIEGGAIPLRAQTLCIHGDHEGSLELAQQLTQALELHSIQIKAPEV